MSNENNFTPELETQSVILETKEQELSRTLSKNILVTFLANFFYLLTRLVLPPIILKYVTLAEYGLWSYCFILLSYLGMSIFGITNVYVRFVAFFATKGESDNINRLVSTGLVTISTICLISIPVFWYGLPYIFPYFNVPQNLMQTAFIVTFSTLLIFIMDLTMGVFGYILHGLQLISLERIIWTISFTIESILIVVLLYAGYGIYALPAAFFFRVVINVVLSTIASYHYLPTLSIKLKYFDKNMFRHFYHFGGIVQLSGLIGIFNRSIEKLMAGIFIGLVPTALYEIGQKFPITATNLPGAVNAVFLPASTQLHANEMKGKIAEMYLQGTRFINITTGMMMGFMAAFSHPIILSWLGNNPQYAIAAVIMSFFTIAYQMDIITGPAGSIYKSINHPEKELAYGILEIILIVLGTAIGFIYFGYTVMVINVCVVSMKVLASLIYLAYSNYFFKIKQTPFWLKVFIPGLFPYLVGYVQFRLMHPWFEAVAQNRWETFGLLIAALGIYMIIVMALTLGVFCSSQERAMLRDHLYHSFKNLHSSKNG